MPLYHPGRHDGRDTALGEDQRCFRAGLAAVTTTIMRVRQCVTQYGLTATLLGFAMLTSGCDDPAGPTAGAIGVTVSTVGTDIDPEGYILWVDRLPVQAVGVNAAVTITDLAMGSHLVQLDELALNCSVSGTNQRFVDVPAGGTATTSFSVSCVGPTQLAFVDTSDGNAEIYVVNSNGTGATRVTTHPASDVDPAWSPDGSRIAFSSDRDGNREIYVMNASGESPVRLTDVAAADYGPTWSHDGGKIAFVSERDGNAEIYVMNADGTNPVRLTTHAANDGDPAWSPDGSRIAFRSVRDGNAEIYVMNADGSGVASRLTNTVNATQPAWSPDGTKIAFSGRSPNSPYDAIFVMNSDGSGVTQLTGAGASGATDPTWSPDGRRVAFAVGYCAFYYFNDYGCFSDVWVVRSDGTGLAALTTNSSAYNPAWRP